MVATLRQTHQDEARGPQTCPTARQLHLRADLDAPPEHLASEPEDRRSPRGLHEAGPNHRRLAELARPTTSLHRG